MALMADRDKIAYHAAGKALVLLDIFNHEANWEGATPEVKITPAGDQDNNYTVGVVLTCVKAPDYWKEKFKKRDSIVRDVALMMAGDVAEETVFGLSDDRRSEMLRIATMMTEVHGYNSMSFPHGASRQEIETMVHESLDLVANVLKDHTQEFDNLTRVFQQCDVLTGKDQILAAAHSGQVPSGP